MLSEAKFLFKLQFFYSYFLSDLNYQNCQKKLRFDNNTKVCQCETQKNIFARKLNSIIFMFINILVLSG